MKLSLIVLSVLLFADGFVWYGSAGAFQLFLVSPDVMLVTLAFCVSFALALVAGPVVHRHKSTAALLVLSSTAILGLALLGYELMSSVGYDGEGDGIGPFAAILLAFDYEQQFALERIGGLDMARATQLTLIALLMAAGWATAIFASVLEGGSGMTTNVRRLVRRLVAFTRNRGAAVHSDE